MLRPWLLIVLSLLLAAQFSWAAAAGYCGHEDSAPSSSAAHFGHHAHAHPGHEGGAEQPALQALTHAVDMEHGHCHLVQAAPASDLVPGLAFEAAAPPLAEEACRVESFVPEGLDRPQWSRA